jgi:ribosome biogenesis protein MAK21
LDKIKQHAFSLLEKENQLYSEIQQQSSSSSHKFYSTIMSSGTLSDKISALTLAVQESPIHNIRALENLVSLSKKRSRAQAVDVLRSLKDMFAQGTLLPSDRKLKAFTNQPSLVAAFQGQGTKWTENSPLPGGLEPKHLIVWAFEDFVKEQFFEVLQVLETWCNDEIEFSRTRAISYVYELLKEKPEQEANLLRLLVNKLGDPGKKIASRASYLLLQLGQAHPVMKPTIISGVEEFLFRPGQSMHAKYYAVITLNQTVLRSKEEKVAIQLLEIYFSLFVILLKPNNDPVKQNSKPHSKGGKGKKNENDSQGSKVKAEEHDDQLKEKLVSAVLTGVNRSYPFTSSDTDRYVTPTTASLMMTNARFPPLSLSKHIDTLFRITHSSNFNTSIQSLMLIQQITATHQVAADRFYRTLYESLLDPRVATSSKQSLYLNLLYKSLKNDLNVKRVKAFVKRIVQVLGLHQPSFICGVFFLIRELEKMYPGLSSLVDQAEEDESDEEEVFRDVPDEEDEEQEVETMPATHETQSRKQLDGYDPRKRDPQHSNADKSCLWELVRLEFDSDPHQSLTCLVSLSHAFPSLGLCLCCASAVSRAADGQAGSYFAHLNSLLGSVHLPQCQGICRSAWIISYATIGRLRPS